MRCSMMYVAQLVVLLVCFGCLGANAQDELYQEQTLPITCTIELRGLPSYTDAAKGLDPRGFVPFELIGKFSMECEGEGTPIVVEVHPHIIALNHTTKGVQLKAGSSGSGFVTFRGITGVTVRGSTFENLLGGGLAPVTVVSSAMQFVDCTFKSNSLARSGGLHITRSTVVMHDCKFYGNSGLSYGAIAAIDNTKLALASSVVEGNVGGTQMDVLGGFVAGGIFAFKNSILKIRDTRIYKNSGTGSGGGALTSVNKCLVEFTNTVFEENKGGAGAIALFQFSEGVLERCTFLHNKATEDEAAPLTLRINSKATLSDAKFIMNTGSSGAILARGDSNVIINVGVFEKNEGDKHSGAVSVFEGADTTISSCTFDKNIGQNGGAFSAQIASNIIVKDSKFVDNVGLRYGGAIFQSHCESTQIEGCTFTGNTADLGGGAVAQMGCKGDAAGSEQDQAAPCEFPELVRCTSVTISGTTFKNNLAEGKGKDIYQKGCMEINLISSTFNIKSGKPKGAIYQEMCATQMMEGNQVKIGSKKVKASLAVVAKDCPAAAGR